MAKRLFILLSFLLTTLNNVAKVVPDEGGHIANGRFVIPAGNLTVRITEKKGAWLTVGDNTELVIDGNIQLEGNSFSGCDIIRVTGSNVHIHGPGSIVGDRWAHKGKEGEWGMGIRLLGATKVTMNGLTIKDCWGDCIYIGKKSSNILIENCHLNNSRRQGISVTSAHGVIIRNCTIANIHGTNPQYAIDIEPNKNCTVNDVLIDHVDVTNCEGGFRALTYRVDERHAVIGSVEIHNCKVSANSRYPIHLNKCKNATVEHCMIDGTNDRPSIYANYVDQLKIRNNTLNVSVLLFSSIINKAKEVVGINDYAPIRVVQSPTQKIVNNRIVEK